MGGALAAARPAPDQQLGEYARAGISPAGYHHAGIHHTLPVPLRKNPTQRRKDAKGQREVQYLFFASLLYDFPFEEVPMTAQMPSKLKEIIEDFEISEGREKLELLLQYAEQLPELPERIGGRDQMEFVPECMTPVYVVAETVDGRMQFFFDVPDESPTVRGFAAVMEEGGRGASPEEILAIPGDFYLQMGLDTVLTHQRLNGMVAILAHMKRLAVEVIGKEA
jgi:cysteine desulfuration protein SufE